MADIKKRSPAADIIRIYAFFCVVAVHFFLQSKFYDGWFEGNMMLVMTILRTSFMICVPLFLMLSGFLMRKKALSVDYYKRISKIIITYVLASIVCILYSKFGLFADITIKTAIQSILSFSGAPYSWYVEMYLGLFLIIPFLNVLYNNIPTKKWKLVLLASFIALTSLPGVVNVYNFNSLDWWLMPSSSFETTKIIPSWWITFYPVTYYFLGCYLSEYGLKIKKSINLILIILVTVLSGAFSFWRSYKGVFAWGEWGDYQALFNVILAVLVFVFFMNLKYTKVSDRAAKFLQTISGLTFGGYLVSSVFDMYFYPQLVEKVPVLTDRFKYFVVMVPLVFVCSLITSYIISKVQFVIEKIIDVITKAIKNKKVSSND